MKSYLLYKFKRNYIRKSVSIILNISYFIDFVKNFTQNKKDACSVLHTCVILVGGWWENFNHTQISQIEKDGYWSSLQKFRQSEVLQLLKKWKIHWTREQGCKVQMNTKEKWRERKSGTKKEKTVNQARKRRKGCSRGKNNKRKGKNSEGFRQWWWHTELLAFWTFSIVRNAR